MQVSIMETDKPETLLTFDDEQINSFREILLSDYKREHPEAQISRRNSFFQKVENAVAVLDARGFNWGAVCDEVTKMWAAIWMSRTLVSPRKKRWGQGRPMFIEVF